MKHERPKPIEDGIHIIVGSGVDLVAVFIPILICGILLLVFVTR